MVKESKADISNQLQGAALGRQKEKLKGIGLETTGYGISFDVVLPLAVTVVALAAHISHFQKPEGEGRLCVITR